jgi:hypothetical protein
MRKNLLLLFASLIVGTFILETASWYIRTHVNRRPLIFQESGDSSFTLVPGKTDYHYTSEYRVEYRVNSRGFRGPEAVFPKPADTKRILFLGDSFAFGYGVRESEAVSFKLNERFIEAGMRNVEVINGGYTAGKSPDDFYAFLRSERGRGFEPDTVVVMVYLGNDFSDVEEHLWERKDSRGLPLKVVSLKDFPNELNGRGPVPWYKRNRLLLGIDTLQLFMHVYTLKVIHPRAGRKAVSGGNHSPAWDLSIPYRFKEVLVGLRGVAEDEGFGILFGIIPKRRQLKEVTADELNVRTRLLKDFLEAEDFRYVFFGREKGFSTADYHIRDNHWNTSGHRKAADVLFHLLLSVDLTLRRR